MWQQMALSGKIPKSQIDKAVDSLIKFVGKKNEKSTSLIEDEDFLYLVCHACCYACFALHSMMMLHISLHEDRYIPRIVTQYNYIVAGDFIEENPRGQR